MSSRKKLRDSINQLETKLLMENARLKKHKQYFSQLLHEHRYLFLGLLIPAFLAGWQEGKRVSTGRSSGLKRFAKYMMSTSLATLNTKNLFK
ncbi:Uncharacterised protein [Legionella hackeliae]|nr:hypothetical protein Lhac_0151 [Legionella hackeliae]STX48094.1 Uncharacterised protein [Legionella hackeliae]